MPAVAKTLGRVGQAPTVLRVLGTAGVIRRHQVPREIVFLDELPGHATGKLLEREPADDEDATE